MQVSNHVSSSTGITTTSGSKMGLIAKMRMQKAQI